MERAIILCSGGLDSVTLAHYKRKLNPNAEIILLFFDYGQRSRKLEYSCVKKCARDVEARVIRIGLAELRSFDISVLTKKTSVPRFHRKNLRDTKREGVQWYVPFRNGIFLSYAFAIAESLFNKSRRKTEIFVGFTCETSESYPDTTISFLKNMNKVGSYAKGKFRIVAPFINKDKEDVVNIGVRSGVDFRKTISCYAPKRNHCGRCLACAMRKAAFYWSAKKDPTKYLEKD